MCYLEESPGVFYRRVTSRGRCLKQVVSSWKWEEAMAQGVISEEQEMWDAEDHVKIRPLIQLGYRPLKGFYRRITWPYVFKKGHSGYLVKFTSQLRAPHLVICDSSIPVLAVTASIFLWTIKIFYLDIPGRGERDLGILNSVIAREALSTRKWSGNFSPPANLIGNDDMT